METLLGLMIGIGLSAACGFRVFVPLPGMSIAALSGYLSLSPEFEWIGTWPALIAFATATVLEIAAYYIPWVDNLLDNLMTPLAIFAGIITTASLINELSPLLRWSLAVIGGGSVSAIIQGGTVLLRAGSSGTTGGLTNPVLSSIETVGSIVITVLAVILPLLCLLIVVYICYRLISKIVHSSFIKKTFN